MPYILSPIINEDVQGLWGEGAAYSRESIYSISPGNIPPVNYEKHIFNSHSLTHVEAPKHVLSEGKTVDQFFESNYFFGSCTVVRLKGNNYKEIGDGIFHWEVSLEELKNSLNGKKTKKLLLTSDYYPTNDSGFHDPNYVLTLEERAAKWLIKNPLFNLYGTSWKSSDFSPGSLERPIHKTLFKQAVITECLDLKLVPEGDYFIVAYPLRIKNSSESPVTPVLFTYEELKDCF